MKRHFKISVILIITFIWCALLSSCSNESEKIEILMQEVGGVYQIPCKVNGVPMNFIFDTGASNVCISLTEALFMYKQGSLKDSDFRGVSYSQVANGDIIPGANVILRKIEIGGIILENINATIMLNSEAPLLLGQSAIRELGSIQILGDKLYIIQTNKGLSWRKWYFIVIAIIGGIIFVIIVFYVMSCPKCGEPRSQLSRTEKEKYDSMPKERESLSDGYQGLSFVQKERYDSLQQERERLYERCHGLIAFFNERKQLYERLRNDVQYGAAIKDSRNIIEHNKDVENKRLENGCVPAIIMVIIYNLVIPIGVLGLYGVFVVISKEDFLRSNQVSGWVLVCVAILAFIYIIIIAKISFNIAQKIVNRIIEKDNKHIDESLKSYENEITKTYLSPFMQKHENEYKFIGRNNLIYEICAPDEITQLILQKIDEIEKHIKQLNKEMLLMTKV